MEKERVKNIYRGAVWYEYFNSSGKRNAKLQDILNKQIAYFKLYYPFLQPKQILGKAYEELDIPHYFGHADKVKLRTMYLSERHPLIPIKIKSSEKKTSVKNISSLSKNKPVSLMTKLLTKTFTAQRSKQISKIDKSQTYRMKNAKCVRFEDDYDEQLSETKVFRSKSNRNSTNTDLQPRLSDKNNNVNGAQSEYIFTADNSSQCQEEISPLERFTLKKIPTIGEKITNSVESTTDASVVIQDSCVAEQLASEEIQKSSETSAKINQNYSIGKDTESQICLEEDNTKGELTNNNLPTKTSIGDPSKCITGSDKNKTYRLKNAKSVRFEDSIQRSPDEQLSVKTKVFRSRIDRNSTNTDDLQSRSSDQNNNENDSCNTDKNDFTSDDSGRKEKNSRLKRFTLKKKLSIKKRINKSVRSNLDISELIEESSCVVRQLTSDEIQNSSENATKINENTVIEKYTESQICLVKDNTRDEFTNKKLPSNELDNSVTNVDENRLDLQSEPSDLNVSKVVDSDTESNKNVPSRPNINGKDFCEVNNESNKSEAIRKNNDSNDSINKNNLDAGTDDALICQSAIKLPKNQKANKDDEPSDLETFKNFSDSSFEKKRTEEPQIIVTEENINSISNYKEGNVIDYDRRKTVVQLVDKSNDFLGPEAYFGEKLSYTNVFKNSEHFSEAVDGNEDEDSASAWSELYTTPKKTSPSTVLHNKSIDSKNSSFRMSKVAHSRDTDSSSGDMHLSDSEEEASLPENKEHGASNDLRKCADLNFDKIDMVKVYFDNISPEPDDIHQESSIYVSSECESIEEVIKGVPIGEYSVDEVSTSYETDQDTGKLIVNRLICRPKREPIDEIIKKENVFETNKIGFEIYRGNSSQYNKNDLSEFVEMSENVHYSNVRKVLESEDKSESEKSEDNKSESEKCEDNKSESEKSQDLSKDSCKRLSDEEDSNNCAIGGKTDVSVRSPYKAYRYECVSESEDYERATRDSIIGSDNKSPKRGNVVDSNKIPTYNSIIENEMLCSDDESVIDNTEDGIENTYRTKYHIEGLSKGGSIKHKKTEEFLKSGVDLRQSLTWNEPTEKHNSEEFQPVKKSESPTLNKTFPPINRNNNKAFKQESFKEWLQKNAFELYNKNLFEFKSKEKNICMEVGSNDDDNLCEESSELTYDGNLKNNNIQQETTFISKQLVQNSVDDNSSTKSKNYIYNIENPISQENNNVIIAGKSTDDCFTDTFPQNINSLAEYDVSKVEESDSSTKSSTDGSTSDYSIYSCSDGSVQNKRKNFNIRKVRAKRMKTEPKFESGLMLSSQEEEVVSTPRMKSIKRTYKCDMSNDDQIENRETTTDFRSEKHIFCDSKKSTDLIYHKELLDKTTEPTRGGATRAVTILKDLNTPKRQKIHMYNPEKDMENGDDLIKGSNNDSASEKELEIENVEPIRDEYKTNEYSNSSPSIIDISLEEPERSTKHTNIFQKVASELKRTENKGEPAKNRVSTKEELSTFKNSDPTPQDIKKNCPVSSLSQHSSYSYSPDNAALRSIRSKSRQLAKDLLLSQEKEKTPELVQEELGKVSEQGSLDRSMSMRKALKDFNKISERELSYKSRENDEPQVSGKENIPTTSMNNYDRKKIYALSHETSDFKKHSVTFKEENIVTSKYFSNNKSNKNKSLKNELNFVKASTMIGNMLQYVSPSIYLSRAERRQSDIKLSSNDANKTEIPELKNIENKTPCKDDNIGKEEEPMEECNLYKLNNAGKEPSSSNSMTTVKHYKEISHASDKIRHERTNTEWTSSNVLETSLNLDKSDRAQSKTKSEVSPYLTKHPVKNIKSSVISWFDSNSRPEMPSPEMETLLRRTYFMGKNK